MLRTILALIPLAAMACFHATAPATTPTYVVQGIVRDSATAQPLAGIYVWPLLESRGTVTDSLGTFTFSWPYPVHHTLLIQSCPFRSLSMPRADLRHDTTTTLDIAIRIPQEMCDQPQRPPWSVAPTDTATFRGFYFYSWEGGGLLRSCDGRLFFPDWESPLGPILRQRQQREGQRTFLRLTGRIVDDGLDTLVPTDFFLVGRIDEARPPEPGDCT